MAHSDAAETDDAGGSRSALATYRLHFVGLALALAITVLVVHELTAVALTSAAVILALPPLVTAAIVDINERRLPNRLLALAAVPLLVALSAEASSALTTQAAIGIALTAGPLLTAHLISPHSIGFGDVKAAAVIGGLLGLLDASLGLVALCIALATTAAVGLALRRRSLPLGPGLVAGASCMALLALATEIGR